jgi:hypothetical protein
LCISTSFVNPAYECLYRTLQVAAGKIVHVVDDIQKCVLKSVAIGGRTGTRDIGYGRTIFVWLEEFERVKKSVQATSLTFVFVALAPKLG